MASKFSIGTQRHVGKYPDFKVLAAQTCLVVSQLACQNNATAEIASSRYSQIAERQQNSADGRANVPEPPQADNAAAPPKTQLSDGLRDLNFARALLERAWDQKSAGYLLYARELAAKAGEMAAQVKGTKSPEYGRCASVVAHLGCQLREYDLAEKLLEEIIGASKDSWAHDRRWAALVYELDMNLAYAQGGLKKYSQAESIYFGVLARCQREAPRVSSGLAAVAHLNLAGLYLEMKEIEKAKSHMLMGRTAIDAELQPESHQRRVAAAVVAAKVLRAEKEYDQAEKLLTQALAQLNSCGRETMLERLQVKLVLGDLYEGMGKRKPAIALLEEVLAVREDRLGEEHELTTQLSSRIGALLESDM